MHCVWLKYILDPPLPRSQFPSFSHHIDVLSLTAGQPHGVVMRLIRRVHGDDVISGADSFSSFLYSQQHGRDARFQRDQRVRARERRARAAMSYLVAQGVQASRITVISYGEERPVCTEKTEDCWARNRRDRFLVKAR